MTMHHYNPSLSVIDLLIPAAESVSLIPERRIGSLGREGFRKLVEKAFEQE